MDFLEFTAGFQSIKHLEGIAIVAPDGEVIESSLPLSDEVIEELSHPLNHMLHQCQEQGRQENRFVINTSKGCLIFRALGENSILLLLDKPDSVDSALKVLTWQCQKLAEQEEENDEHSLVTEPPAEERPLEETSIAPEEELAASPAPLFNLADKPAAQPAAEMSPALATVAPAPQLNRPNPFATQKRSNSRWILPTALFVAIAVGIVYIARQPEKPPLGSPLAEIESVPAPTAPATNTSPASSTLTPAATRTVQPAEVDLPELVIRGNFPLGSLLTEKLTTSFLEEGGNELEDRKQRPAKITYDYSNQGKTGRITVAPLGAKDAPFADTDEPLVGSDDEKLALISSFRFQPLHYKRLAKAGADFAPGRSETVIGMDAVVFILHPDNPYYSLTPSQLKELLSGGITNWSRFNQPDTPVTVYVLPWHQSNTPNLGMDLFGLTGTRLTEAHQTLPTAKAVIEAVEKDPGGIAILPASQVPDGQRLLGVVSSETGKVVAPGKWAISQFSYPFSHFVYAYAPLGASNTQKRFMDFLTSDKGKQKLQEAGLVLPKVPAEVDGRETAMRHRLPLYNNQPEGLQDFVAGCDRVDTPSLHFYPKGGGVPAESLSGLVDQAGANRSYRVVAHANSREEDTIQIGKWVEQELRKQGATDVAYFSASNRSPLYTKDDRVAPRLNNRVEIWTSHTAP